MLKINRVTHNKRADVLANDIVPHTSQTWILTAPTSGVYHTLNFFEPIASKNPQKLLRIKRVTAGKNSTRHEKVATE